MMCSPFFLILAISAGIGFFEKVLTASIPDDAVPHQTSGEPTNGYDSPNLGSLSSDEGLANLSPTSPPPFLGSDGVNTIPNIDVKEPAAAAGSSPFSVMMTDSTPNNPSAKYPKPVCLIMFWPLCCHGKIYDRFGKISECFEWSEDNIICSHVENVFCCFIYIPWTTIGALCTKPLFFK